MQTAFDLFNRWKTARDFKTDAAAAAALQLSDGAPSNWRHGRSKPDNRTVLKMAEDLGEDPTPYVLEVTAEREHRPDVKRRILELARKAAKAAAMLLLGCGMANRAQCHNMQNATFDINVAEYTYALIRRWFRLCKSIL